VLLRIQMTFAERIRKFLLLLCAFPEPRQGLEGTRKTLRLLVREGKGNTGT